MKIINIDVMDGRPQIEVVISECGYSDEEARLKRFLHNADKAFADAEEHYQRGYNDAINFIAAGEAA